MPVEEGLLARMHRRPPCNRFAAACASLPAVLVVNGHLRFNATARSLAAAGQSFCSVENDDKGKGLEKQCALDVARPFVSPLGGFSCLFFFFLTRQP